MILPWLIDFAKIHSWIISSKCSKKRIPNNLITAGLTQLNFRHKSLSMHLTNPIQLICRLYLFSVGKEKKSLDLLCDLVYRPLKVFAQWVVRKTLETIRKSLIAHTNPLASNKSNGKPQSSHTQTGLFTLYPSLRKRSK